MPSVDRRAYATGRHVARLDAPEATSRQWVARERRVHMEESEAPSDRGADWPV